MTKINLREHYPNFYKNDCIIEVPDEVAAIMLEYDRLEAAYRRRTYYHKPDRIWTTFRSGLL